MLIAVKPKPGDVFCVKHQTCTENENVNSNCWIILDVEDFYINRNSKKKFNTTDCHAQEICFVAKTASEPWDDLAQK